MNILVTGSCGFLGGAVCRELRRRGHTVIGADLPQAVREHGQSGDVGADIADSRFPETVLESAPTLHALIHCAAFISYDDADPRLLRVNVEGTHNVLRLARMQRVASIVFASGSTVIGAPAVHPIDENHPIDPQALYHATKRMGELILNLARKDGSKVAHIRIPAPVGAGMNPNSILPVFVRRCLGGEPIALAGTGSRRQNYIAATDIARALADAALLGADGVYGIGNTLISNRELAELCRDVTHSGSPIFLSGKPDPADGQVWDICVDKARRELGFSPSVPLEATVLELARSMGMGEG